MIAGYRRRHLIRELLSSVRNIGRILQADLVVPTDVLKKPCEKHRQNRDEGGQDDAVKDREAAELFADLFELFAPYLEPVGPVLFDENENVQRFLLGLHGPPSQLARLNWQRQKCSEEKIPCTIFAGGDVVHTLIQSADRGEAGRRLRDRPPLRLRRRGGGMPHGL